MKGVCLAMAIVNEIKCARCDRKYSGVRSRCPYCGARRIGRGKYSENTADNAKGKMLISVLIMAAFTVAAGVLLFTTPGIAEEPDDPPDEEPTTNNGNIEDNIVTQPGLHPEPPVVEDTPEPEPTPPPMVVTSLSVVTSDGNPLPFRDEFTFHVGDTLGLQVRTEPPGAEREFEILWTTSNPEVFDVVVIPLGDGLPHGYGATVTGTGTGNATLTIAVGDVETTVTVRVTR